VHLAGMIGLEPASMKLISESVEEQTIQVLRNLERVLFCVRSTPSDVLVLRWYLTQKVCP